MHMQCWLGYMLNQVVKKSKETVIEGIEKFGVIKRQFYFIYHHYFIMICIIEILLLLNILSIVIIVIK